MTNYSLASFQVDVTLQEVSKTGQRHWQNLSVAQCFGQISKMKNVKATGTFLESFIIYRSLLYFLQRTGDIQL